MALDGRAADQAVAGVVAQTQAAARAPTYTFACYPATLAVAGAPSTVAAGSILDGAKCDPEEARVHPGPARRRGAYTAERFRTFPYGSAKIAL
jgi:hypothetical protein